MVVLTVVVLEQAQNKRPSPTVEMVKRNALDLAQRQLRKLTPLDSHTAYRAALILAPTDLIPGVLGRVLAPRRWSWGWSARVQGLPVVSRGAPDQTRDA